ncbi:interferon alpha-2-like [Equus quagga]|uniref:interferon alpha-2-like n=1 Tax=Equus quagga TaxID=89248 RepID=UPI001EE2DFA1|nr:interferon alpha-2-like [Equus quagga]
MAQIHLLVAGVMLCSILACSLGRDSLWIHSLKNREIFMLLRQLEKIHSKSCLNDGTYFKFPWESETITQIRKTQGTCFHYVMLQQIINLFNTDDSRAAWNNALLDQLLSRLDHSLEQLEEENLACPYLGTVAWNYFQKINHYLKEKEFSPCAWEVVRGEMEVCLSLM